MRGTEIEPWSRKNIGYCSDYQRQLQQQPIACVSQHPFTAWVPSPSFFWRKIPFFQPSVYLLQVERSRLQGWSGDSDCPIRASFPGHSYWFKDGNMNQSESLWCSEAPCETSKSRCALVGFAFQWETCSLCVTGAVESFYEKGANTAKGGAKETRRWSTNCLHHLNPGSSCTYSQPIIKIFSSENLCVLANWKQVFVLSWMT